MDGNIVHPLIFQNGFFNINQHINVFYLNGKYTYGNNIKLICDSVSDSDITSLSLQVTPSGSKRRVAGYETHPKKVKVGDGASGTQTAGTPDDTPTTNTDETVVSTN